jgi:hypothetical protein
LFEGHGLLLLSLVLFVVIVLLDLAVELYFLVVDGGVLCAQSPEGGIDFVVEGFVE